MKTVEMWMEDDLEAILASALMTHKQRIYVTTRREADYFESIRKLPLCQKLKLKHPGKPLTTSKLLLNIA